MSYTLSGHETFACRYFWLKKGFDFHQNSFSFSQDNAVVHLGVGKNMVNSIKFWLRAFGLESQNEKELLESIFAENGFDPYLEDNNTLWILHYIGIKVRFASIYSLLFNDFNPRTEFSLNEFEYYLKKKFDSESFQYSENTLKSDINVIESMYIRSARSRKSLEDEYTGLFQDLGLFEKTSNDRIYVSPRASRNVSSHVFLYILMDCYGNAKSISFNKLLNDDDSIGKVFCLNHSALFDVVEKMTNDFDFITFTDDAGVRELQIKGNPYMNKLGVLKAYYNEV